MVQRHPGDEPSHAVVDRHGHLSTLVRSFADGNGDGIGDFKGLASRLPYLRWLGVKTLWLTPIYPSPLRDGGYDITDFKDIHPDLGDLASFHRFLTAAHSQGMRVILDLVLNHTSDLHPWFQRGPAGLQRAVRAGCLRLE